MKPKEKAIELINIFREFADGTDPETDRYSPKIEKEKGKKCALVAVNEILSMSVMNEFGLEFTKKYWIEVKNELEKL